LADVKYPHKNCKGSLLSYATINDDESAIFDNDKVMLNLVIDRYDLESRNHFAAGVTTGDLQSLVGTRFSVSN
jgi:hypothetical protein